MTETNHSAHNQTITTPKATPIQGEDKRQYYYFLRTIFFLCQTSMRYQQALRNLELQSVMKVLDVERLDLSPEILAVAHQLASLRNYYFANSFLNNH